MDKLLSTEQANQLRSELSPNEDAHKRLQLKVAALAISAAVPATATASQLGLLSGLAKISWVKAFFAVAIATGAVGGAVVSLQAVYPRGHVRRTIESSSANTRAAVESVTHEMNLPTTATAPPTTVRETEISTAHEPPQAEGRARTSASLATQQRAEGRAGSEQASAAQAGEATAVDSTHTTATDRIAIEARAVRAIDEAVRARGTSAASLIARYRAEHPNGVMHSEVNALEVIAGCMTNRDRSQQAGQTFLTNNPTTMLRARIISACEL